MTAGPPYRERSEPVGDALRDVRVEVDPGVDGHEKDGLNQDAREQELEVRSGRAAMAPPKR